MSPDHRSNNIYIYISEDEQNLITLLRVLAAFAVLLIHISQHSALPAFALDIANYGGDGINLFSLLTGYLVMNSYARSRSGREFWHKRIRRLLPLYYVMLLFYLIRDWNWFMQEPLSILRSMLLLNYVLPSTASYNYTALYLLGTIPIFMMFYAAIPWVSKRIKKIEGAFVLLLSGTLIRLLIPTVYLRLFGGSCPPGAIYAMVGYFWEKAVYFLCGIVLYYGKRDDRVPQALVYLLFLWGIGARYSFLNLLGIATFPLLAVILLCYPIPLPQCVMRLLRWLDELGMGLLVVQMPLLIWYSEFYAGRYGTVPHGIALLPLFLLPYLAAIAVHYAVELPGQKLVDKLMVRSAQDNSHS